MKQNNKKFGIVALFAIFCLCFFNGCATRTSGVEGGQTVIDTPDGKQFSNYLMVYNPSLAGRIQIVELKSAVINDLLKAQVSLASTKNKTLSFQYKFAWFDKNGMEIDSSGNAWNPIVVHGKEFRNLQAVAPNASAKSFKVKIRSIDE